MKQRSTAPQYGEATVHARHHRPQLVVSQPSPGTDEIVARGEYLRLILDRVHELPGVLYRPSRTSLQFDIELCHKHTPLDLPALLQSDDRQTGRLLDGFTPVFRVANTQG